MNLCRRLDTPAGELVLLGTEHALTGVFFTDGRCPSLDGVRSAREPFAAACAQLEAYFAGALRAFDLPLDPPGTPFRRRVWAALSQIPYGETRTYGALAAQLGSGPRAVGFANGANPLSIVVPCHRLVGAAGALTGYGGGLERKRFLLDLEQEWLRAQPSVLQ